MGFKYAIFGFLGVLLCSNSYAQLNILNAKAPEEIGRKSEVQLEIDNDGPLPYGYTDDRDVVWGKMVWEKIDLDERANFPLYYPLDTVQIGAERRSLYDVLVKNIKNGRIPRIYADSYFANERTLDDLSASMAYRDTTDVGVEQYNAEGVIDPQYIRSFVIDASDVQEYLVRGYWYIDKRQGELKYRLIALAPVVNEARTKAFPDEISQPIPMFWIFYPDAREVLHEAKVYNNQNSAQPISFDHLLNSRRFSGVIYKEDNMYEDREIKDYVKDDALMQLWESNLIKERIRNIEIDLWNY